MFKKSVILFLLLFFNTVLVISQTIHYDYDDSGNRVERYIVLSKGNSSDNEKLPFVEDTNSSRKDSVNNKSDEFEDKLGELTVKIFPNPTHGSLSVEINGLGPDETIDYQVFSKTGMLLATKQKLGYQFNVEMENYPAGLYILNLMIKGKTSQWKILKE
jgi:hypothetical protein